MSYDQNGNILTMNQMGLKLNTSSLIDSLVYGYTTNSNKLNYVTDKVNDATSTFGDFLLRRVSLFGYVFGRGAEASDSAVR